MEIEVTVSRGTEEDSVSTFFTTENALIKQEYDNLVAEKETLENQCAGLTQQIIPIKASIATKETEQESWLKIIDDIAELKSDWESALDTYDTIKTWEGNTVTAVEIIGTTATFGLVAGGTVAVNSLIDDAIDDALQQYKDELENMFIEAITNCGNESIATQEYHRLETELNLLYTELQSLEGERAQKETRIRQVVELIDALNINV